MGCVWMEKRKLFSRIIIGAIIGASTALLDKDVRHYTKKRLINAKDKTSYFVKNPSKTVGEIRTKLNQLNNTLSGHARQAIDTLEQLEQTLEKFVDKK